MPASSASASEAPGTPSSPTTVLSEDFENNTGNTGPTALTDYVGASGQRYTADPTWLTACNGQIRNFTMPTTAKGTCSSAYTASMGGQMASVLGSHAAPARRA